MGPVSGQRAASGSLCTWIGGTGASCQGATLVLSCRLPFASLGPGDGFQTALLRYVELLAELSGALFSIRNLSSGSTH